jgi:hypothetical protein
MSFSLRDESVPDACPLTTGEKTLKVELESVVRAAICSNTLRSVEKVITIYERIHSERLQL